MINHESNSSNFSNDFLGERMCNLNYLFDMMGGKKHLIKEIIDVFLLQVPAELKSINDAIQKTDYVVIRTFSHTMKSSVSIMGISKLTPVLQEMENLAANGEGIEKIKKLNELLADICKLAINEIEIEKRNYN